MGLYQSKPTDFAAQKLAPLIEASRSAGKPFHVIHDEVFPSNPQVKSLDVLDDILSDERFLSDFEREDRKWRYAMKRRIESSDFGNPDFPELKLITESNRRNHGVVVNHMGFYPLEASLERVRAVVAVTAARDMLTNKDSSGATNSMIEAHKSLANSVILRDTELAKQITRIGSDVVVLRNFSHVYLSQVDDYEFPIVGGPTVLTLAQVYGQHGIALDGDSEETELTFSDLAVNKLCLGICDEHEQRTLAFMQLSLLAYMAKNGLWSHDGGIEEGIAATNVEYEKLVVNQKRKAAGLS